ncbi:MAG: hypothetical protein NDI82_09770 [Anaeromyxobacteraceae bacterium]|nr:hypothetical protein [Anaeromyxobacteraceae bacterium]
MEPQAFVPSLALLLGLLGGVLLLVVASRSFAIAKGNQVILLERRWFGRQMPDAARWRCRARWASRRGSSAPGSTCSSPSSTG